MGAVSFFHFFLHGERAKEDDTVGKKKLRIIEIARYFDKRTKLGNYSYLFELLLC